MHWLTLSIYLAVVQLTFVLIYMRYRDLRWVIAHPVLLTTYFSSFIYIIPMFRRTPSNDLTFWLVIVGFMGLLVGTLFYHVFPRRRGVVSRSASPVNSRMIATSHLNAALIVALVATTAFVGLVVVKRGDYSLYSHFYMETRRGTAWVYTLMTWSSLMFAYLVAVERTAVRDPRMLLVTLLVVGGMVLRGNRGTFILLAALVIVWTLWTGRRSILLAPVIVAWMAGGMVATSYLRYDAAAERLQSYFSTGFFGDFDTLYQLDQIVERIDELGHQNGRTLYDAGVYFVPRALWPNKPVSTVHSRLMYPRVTQAFPTNYTIGLVGTTYLNFGAIAVFLEHLMFAFALCWIFDRLRRRLASGDLTNAYIYAYLLVSAAMVVNNDGLMNKQISKLLMWVIVLKVSFRASTWMQQLLASHRRKTRYPEGASLTRPRRIESEASP